MKKWICLILALILVLSLSACGTNDALLDAYVEALNECDGEMLLELYPEVYIEQLVDDGWYSDEDEIAEVMEEILTGLYDEAEDSCGDDVVFSYKITGREDLKEDDLEDIQDRYDDELNEDVEAARLLEIQLTAKGEDDEDSDEIELLVVMIDEEWFLDYSNFTVDYKALLDSYIECMNTCDGKQMLRLYHQAYINHFIEEEWYENEDEIVEELADSLTSRYDDYQYSYGGNPRISYSLLSAEAITGDDLEAIISRYASNYDIAVQAAKYIELELIIQTNANDGTETRSMRILKIDGDWYLG